MSALKRVDIFMYENIFLLEPTSGVEPLTY